jgi:hypothetical protein
MITWFLVTSTVSCAWVEMLTIFWYLLADIFVVSAEWCICPESSLSQLIPTVISPSTTPHRIINWLSLTCPESNLSQLIPDSYMGGWWPSGNSLDHQSDGPGSNPGLVGQKFRGWSSLPHSLPTRMSCSPMKESTALQLVQRGHEVSRQALPQMTSPADRIRKNPGHLCRWHRKKHTLTTTTDSYIILYNTTSDN